MSILASDNFNRANGALGANWTNQSQGANNVQIASNQVEATLANDFEAAFWSAITWPNDQFSQATLIRGDTSGQSGGGPIVRVSSSAFTMYYVFATEGTPGTIQIAKIVAGSFTPVSTVTPNVSANDVLLLTVQGTTLRCFQNGTQATSVTDAAISSGSPGLSVNPGFGSVVTDAEVDNWSGGDFQGTELGRPDGVRGTRLMQQLLAT